MSPKKIVLIFIIVISILAAIICGFLVINLLAKNNSVNQIKQEFIETPKILKLSAVPAFVMPEPEVTLLAVGDIMLSRSVEQQMIKKNDFTLPFSPLANLTKSADITFGNLETAILPGRQINTGEFLFRTNPKSIAGLQAGGFDLVSLANNHTPNFGIDGLNRTFAALNQGNISFVGAGTSDTLANQPVIIEKQGIKFGFLAYVYPQIPKDYQATANRPGVAFMDLVEMKVAVKNLKPQVDFVIVSMHAGTEYVPEPNQEQIDFAHGAIDGGASLVIGSHPHVVQTVEKYHNGYIFYSLGNFIFDQLWSQDTQQGLMVKITFRRCGDVTAPSKGIKDIEFIPIKIDNNFAANLADATTTKKIIDRLKIPTTIQSKFYWNGVDYFWLPSYEIENSFFEQGAVTSPRLAREVYQEKYLPDGKKLQAIIVDNTGYVILDGKNIWQSDSGYKVENVLIGDFNNDKIDEIGFSLWKQGSFGPHLPFWQKENDKNISNHLFLYQLDEGAVTSPHLRMTWGSSALDNPIIKMALVDLDQDGKNELAVLEQANSAGAILESRQTDLGIWKFNDFNFFNIFKSEPGNYFDLKADLNYIYLTGK
ncbi:MAG: CapA family protein [Candidatus Buchananbacteria bacterium]